MSNVFLSTEKSNFLEAVRLEILRCTQRMRHLVKHEGTVVQATAAPIVGIVVEELFAEEDSRAPYLGPRIKDATLSSVVDAGDEGAALIVGTTFLGNLAKEVRHDLPGPRVVILEEVSHQTGRATPGLLRRAAGLFEATLEGALNKPLLLVVAVVYEIGSLSERRVIASRDRGISNPRDALYEPGA